MPSKDLLPLYLLLKRQNDMVGVCFIVSVCVVVVTMMWCAFYGTSCRGVVSGVQYRRELHFMYVLYHYITKYSAHPRECKKHKAGVETFMTIK